MYTLTDWHEATTDNGAPAPAPGPRYRLATEDADVRYASGAQREELIKLLNSHQVYRWEKTKMLLHLGQLSTGYAARAIANVRHACAERDPNRPRPGALALRLPAMLRRGDTVHYAAAA